MPPGGQQDLSTDEIILLYIGMYCAVVTSQMQVLHKSLLWLHLFFIPTHPLRAMSARDEAS